jgi:hypothetical protein
LTDNTTSKQQQLTKMPLIIPREVTEVFGWESVQSDAFFTMQKKHTRKNSSSTNYRIIINSNQFQIATATTKKEIVDLWNMLHPQKKPVTYSASDTFALVERVWKECQETIDTNPIHNIVR